MRRNWPFGLVWFFVGMVAALVMTHSRRESAKFQKTESRPVSPAASPSSTNQAEGIIEALKIPFADSEVIFADKPVRLRDAQWFFENYSVPQLVEFLGKCQLTREQANDLSKTSRVEIATNGCLVTPSSYLITTLTPCSRARIYSALEGCPFNYAQQYPFRFGVEAFESRLEACGLSSNKLQRLKSLTYTNAGELCFADLELLPTLLSPTEFKQTVDSLYRFPVYQLRLRVPQGANVDEMVRYWGRGGREQKIRPFLYSLAKVNKAEGSTVSIVHLLPVFAQTRLYTYPSAWKDSTVDKEDCFWSSMNFFNDSPDQGFLESNYTRQELASHYHMVQGQAKLGDLLALVDKEGNGLHMCVYIADNFVFTKNGVNILSPWVIMKCSDMLLLFFPSNEDRKLVTYRRNDMT
jgi:hypothetical protein